MEKLEIVGHIHMTKRTLWQRIKMFFGWNPYKEIIKQGSFVDPELMKGKK